MFGGSTRDAGVVPLPPVTPPPPLTLYYEHLGYQPQYWGATLEVQELFSLQLHLPTLTMLALLLTVLAEAPTVVGSTGGSGVVPSS